MQYLDSLNSPVEGVVLSDLLAELGPHIARLIGTAAASPVVRGIEYYDALDALSPVPGLILLAPSIAGVEGAGFDRLAVHASELGYAALAVKCRDTDAARLAAIASASAVPLIRVGEQVSWRHFEALLSRVIGDQASPEGIPVDRGAEPLFALANQLASRFGGSVAIEDLERRVVAYSSVPGQLIDRLRTQGILARRVPDYPFNDDEYRLVLRADAALKFPRIGDEEPRVACAIRAGALPLGSIWAIDATGDVPLTAEQDQLIRGAAAVAAGHMLNALRVHKSSQQPREDRLHTLLDGAEVAGAELAELGISEERGGALCAFDLGPAAQPSSLAQLRSIVQRQLALHRPEVVTAERSGRIYALIDHEVTRSISELLEPLLAITDRLVGDGVRVAVPGIAHRSFDVATLRDLADRLLDTAAAGPKPLAAGNFSAPAGRILTVPLLRPLLVFERTTAMFAEAEELRSPAVERLAREDPQVAAALTAWLSCFGNIARTARMLDVHENTVRYRIRRAQEHYGIELTDTDTMLTTWLELRSLRS